MIDINKLSFANLISFRNLNNKTFGIIFYAALFAWPLILSLIKPRDIKNEFQ